MVVARFSSPFAPLKLSLDEKEQLGRMADTILSETMAMYERFLWQDKGRLDPATWLQVREHEQTRVFHNRLPGGGTSDRDMHLLVGDSSLVGTLADAMYGVLNATTEAMRIKSSYVANTLLDMCLLESIVQPTAEEPFESMVVRWSLKGVPLHVRLVTKHTDAVYLEVTGMRQLANGERVGVHLQHTVSFDKTPLLPQYDRVNVSICTIWRQTSTDHVQSFVKSYFGIKDSFKVNMVVMSMADALLSYGNVIECAQLKKLAWLVQNKRAGSQCEVNSGRAPEEGCSVCGSQHRSARRGMKSACAVCTKYTCDKCRVKRTLSLFAPDGQLLRHEMRFCVPCIHSATNLDAAAVATDDACAALSRSAGDGNHDYFGGHSYTMSSSSSSSASSSHSGNDLRVPRLTDSQVKTTTLALSASSSSTRAPE